MGSQQYSGGVPVAWLAIDGSSVDRDLRKYSTSLVMGIRAEEDGNLQVTINGQNVTFAVTAGDVIAGQFTNIVAAGTNVATTVAFADDPSDGIG